MSDWNPNAPSDSSNVPPPLNPGSGVAMQTCVECGNSFPADEMIHHGNVSICANCKPVFMQKLTEGARVDPHTFRYAGFWIRVLAILVDGIFMFGLVLVVILLLGVFFGVFRRGSQSGPMTQTESLVLGLSIDLFFLIIVVVYETFMIGKFGATLGKMACRIKVVTADGGRVSYLRALGRFGGKILSNMTFYIGYIIAGFDSQKRSLHDHICGTRVIYK